MSARSKVPRWAWFVAGLAAVAVTAATAANNGSHAPTVTTSGPAACVVLRVNP